MKIIYVVDDNETNIEAVRIALEGHFRIYGLPMALRMFKLAEKIIPDLILLDVDMPEIDGFQAFEMIKKHDKLKNVPVVFLTARQDAESEIKGFEMGALDFIYKPFSPPVLLRRIQSHIETDKIIKDSIKSVKDIHNATISAIAHLVDCRDKITGGHIQRTQTYLGILIEGLSKRKEFKDMITDWDMSVLLPSAQLHDMGKISVSDIILNKPGPLTHDEYNIMKCHCLEGEKLVDRIMSETESNSFLIHAKRFAGTHHEKWNGTGYPRGLKGEEIPLEGRIMAVADVFDALVSERPYKKALTHEEAVELIRKESGTHFDPRMVDVFLDVSEDIWVEFMSMS